MPREEERRLRRLVFGRELTARRAAAAITATTVAATVLAAFLIRVVDSEEFSTPGSGFWWAVQTVTTVGYGDLVPQETAGRIIAVVVMLLGTGFFAVLTGTVTAALVEDARRRRGALRDPEVAEQLDEIAARLERLEAALRERG